MSFVTTVCGDALAAPAPDPCAARGAVIRHANATGRHHPVHCRIHTSREKSEAATPVDPAPLARGAERQADVETPPRGWLVIAARGGVDDHRSDVQPVEDVVDPQERGAPHRPRRPVPPQPRKKEEPPPPGHPPPRARGPGPQSRCGAPPRGGPRKGGRGGG